MALRLIDWIRQYAEARFRLDHHQVADLMRALKEDGHELAHQEVLMWTTREDTRTQSRLIQSFFQDQQHYDSGLNVNV